jgi:putative transposase
VAERAQVLAVCHEPAYASLPPGQIVPRRADEGRYLASESSFYRLLRAADEQHHRGRRPRAPGGAATTGGARPQPSVDVGY